MKDDVKINIETIKEFSSDIELEGKKFFDILNKLTLEIEKMEEFFDTPTGKVLKEKLNNYISSQKQFVNDKYMSYSKTILNIANVYDQTDFEISSMVNNKGEENG